MFGGRIGLHSQCYDMNSDDFSIYSNDDDLDPLSPLSIVQSIHNTNIASPLAAIVAKVFSNDDDPGSGSESPFIPSSDDSLFMDLESPDSALNLISNTDHLILNQGIIESKEETKDEASSHDRELSEENLSSDMLFFPDNLVNNSLVSPSHSIDNFFNTDLSSSLGLYLADKPETLLKTHDDSISNSNANLASFSNGIVNIDATMFLPNGTFIDRMDINITIEESQCVIEGDQKRWKCQQCEKSYTTKHNLVTHVLGHSGIKPHVCQLCSKAFRQLSHLNTHMLTHEKVKPHKCHICQRTFAQMSHVKRHIMLHANERPHICKICQRGFAFPGELKAHVEKHQKTKQNVCNECGKEFMHEEQLRSHQNKHTKTSELICSICKQVFQFPSKLKDHMIGHSSVRPFVCAECGMEFMREQHLKAHQLTHSNVRPFGCPDCGKSFTQKANLKRHQQIHSGERRYKCHICDRSFTQEQVLKMHMIMHADKKPFTCSVCGKEFGRTNNLRAHMHIHSEEKPFKCHCGSSFTQKGLLTRHQKVKHSISDRPCTSNENLFIDLAKPNRKQKSYPRKRKYDTVTPSTNSVTLVQTTTNPDSTNHCKSIKLEVVGLNSNVPSIVTSSEEPNKSKLDIVSNIKALHKAGELFEWSGNSQDNLFIKMECS